MDQTFLGNSLWQYMGCMAVVAATMIARVVAKQALDVWLKKITTKSQWDLDDQLLAAMRRPAFFLVWVCGFFLAFEILTLPKQPVDLARFINALFTSLLIIDAAWFLYQATTVLSIYLERLTGKTESKLDDQLVPIVQKSLRVIIVLMTFVMIIQNLGYSVSSLLAGLGLGGLAFALAAKDSLANLFGSVTIFTDRPFQIGDWIKMAGVEGVVEDVGFRSTRVRTFGKTLITIPNSKIATSTIENMDARPIRRISTTLGLTYDASPDQMEELVEALRELLRTHPGVDQGYHLVYFTKLGNSALEVFLYFFSKSTVWAEFLNLQQEINLAIMRILERMGLEIAFPSQTVYLKPEQTQA